MNELSFFNIGTPALLSLIGALLAAIGAFVSSAESNRQQNKAEAAQKLALSKSDEISQLAETIANQAEENAKLSKQIIGLTSGGESFTYLSFTKMGDYWHPVVLHKGDFPLFEVNVRIVDLQELEAIQSPSLESVNRHFFEIDSLPVGQAHIHQALRFKIENANRSFNVFFSARNGNWEQETRFILTEDGRLKSLASVYQNDGEDRHELFMQEE